MKAGVAFALPILAQAVVNTQRLQARQFDLMGLANSYVPPIDPVSTIKLTPEFDKKAIREKIIWGPFKAHAANGTHAGGAYLKLDPNSDIVSTRVNGICTNCVVLTVSADITDKTGTKLDLASGIYSHHIISADFGRSMIGPPIVSMCPNGKQGGFNFESFASAGKGGKPMSMFGVGIGGSHGAKDGKGGGGHNMNNIKNNVVLQKRQLGDILETLASSLIPKFSFWFAQGDDGTRTNFAAKGSDMKSGFYMGPDNKVNLMSEVINYENVEKDFYMALDYEYIPNLTSLPKDYYDVGLGAITVVPCSSANLHPPNDKAIMYESPKYAVNGDGYIMDVKAHLHDGGINMTFVVNGKEQCTNVANYGGTDGGFGLESKEKWETITSYTPCPDPIHIKKGDDLRMRAYYDVTKHRLRPLSDNQGESAEGMALAIFMWAQQSTR